MALTKKDIIMKIAEETALKQIHVKQVVQKTFDKIIEALNKGETVELRNFGIFKAKVRKGRVGRNPRTGEEVTIPNKKIVSFKAGLEMREKVK